MTKEKLKFKIAGKSIVYEGYPENRPKDLMDILAKLSVSEDVVVPTFRENIEGESQYTDDQIRSLFSAAAEARSEKKRAKNTTAAAASPEADTANPNAASGAKQSEQKQKITLSCCGKQFSYEGYPSEKQKAVVQLLSKQKGMTQQVVVETFRENLPDSRATVEEIWEMVSEKTQARGRGNAAAGAAAAPAAAGAASAGAGAGASGDNRVPSSGSAGTGADYGAIDELAGISSKERDEINNFIRQVLEQPETDVAALIRAEPRAAKDNDADDVLAQTQARTAGKVPVYCQEKDTNVKKLVYALPSMSYQEFADVIEKKFGRKMDLSFYEGDDMIELDDDDVLAMFLEMSVQSDSRKLNLICSSVTERASAVEEEFTQGNNVSAVEVNSARAKAYSNGELAVKEVRSYPGHSLAVYCCSFSPKGDQFVTASRDRSVRLWNVRTGSCNVMKGGHNGFVLSCDFSPKGNRVVSSSDDRTIKVWNTTSCSKVATLKGHEDKVYCVQYNPDGKYIVSGSCDHTVRVWDAESCSKVATLKGHSLAVFSCCFCHSDRGKYIASGSDDRLIKIWDWEAGKEVRSMVGHIGTVWSVQYSHNDQFIVSASMDHELKLWDATTGACVRTMAGHKTPIHHAAFSDNDKYIFSCARDWTVMAWRTATGEHVETITGHLSTVYHVDVQGNKMLTSSLDDTLKLWEVTQKIQ